MLIYSSLPSTIHWQRTFWIFGEEIWAPRTSSPNPDFQAHVWNETGMWPTDRPKLQHLPAIRAVRRRACTCHSACCAFAFTVALACCFSHQPNSLEETTMVFICLLFVGRGWWDVQTINGCFLSGSSRIPPSGQKWSWKLNTWQNVKYLLHRGLKHVLLWVRASQLA